MRKIGEAGEQRRGRVEENFRGEVGIELIGYQKQKANAGYDYVLPLSAMAGHPCVQMELSLMISSNDNSLN